MIDKAKLCNDDLLLDLIHDQLSDDQVDVMLHHVETCTACRHRMEELAAAAKQWQKTVDMLSSSGGDASIGKSFALNAKVLQFQQIASPIEWSESMAKELLSPPSHPEMLGRIGRYEVERLIGAGGMGVVFKGFDTELNRPVAIKVLAPHLAGSGSARQRFAREARAAAAVVHDHVVPIYNVETQRQTPFLVMKYIAGESLQVRIDKEGPLEAAEILRIGMQVAAGLAAAHEQGLVHRDIKPLNILLEQGLERALITDFGLARAVDDASLTHTGFHAGTPQYMSPEQVSGDSVDGRSDLFSLGSVLYAMCTGRPPFRAESSFGVLKRIAEETQRSIREVNPRIPPWLECIVNKLLAKNPDSRLKTAAETSQLLAKCLAHLQDPSSNALPAIVETWITEQSSERMGHRRISTNNRFASWLQTPSVKLSLLLMSAWALGVAMVLAAFLRLTTDYRQLSTAEREARRTAQHAQSSNTTSDVLEGAADSATRDGMRQNPSPLADPSFLSSQEFEWEAAINDFRNLQHDVEEFETKLMEAKIQ